MDIPRNLKRFFCYSKTMSGKITFITAFAASLAVLIVFVGLFMNVHVQKVSADNVTTSVTVLNTPPVWTIDAQEITDSATSTPTNAGDVVRWKATGTDSNGDSYWLLICKTNATPSPGVNSAPTCGGGISNQWAVSASTTSGVLATAATTTKETFPFNAEKNDWYGWICDGNSSLPQCNLALKQGVSTPGPSPFFVDHPPTFTSLSSTGNANPGSNIIWSVTATTTDIIRGGDTLRLFVCKSNDFTAASTSAACGAGGTWATSTLVTINPTATFTIPIPTQDKTYAAYVYLTNNFNLAATSTLEGSSSPYVVNNVAPSISAASVSLVNYTGSGNLTLINPNSTSGPYKVQFQVTDNNSCLNASSGNEISTVTANAYRSAVGSSSCRLLADYNSNSCYPQASALTNFSCTQDVASCTGATDSTATFTCTFSLWYNADPTDTGTQYPSQNWLASAQATDDQALNTGGFVEASTGNELVSFLAFTVPQTSIPFGGLQPGQQNDPLSPTTTLRAIGNVGLDENLYGDTMCTSWSAPDSCDVGGADTSRQIAITNQKAATSTVSYASAPFTLSGSTSPVSVGIHVLKTTSTSSPQSKDTFWAIRVPVTITVAGNYSGQNTITALTSAASNW